MELNSKKMISIVTVNWWGKDFAELLVKRAREFAVEQPEIIIVDNSGELEDLDATILKPTKNIGHGRGMDYGIYQAKGSHIMALDIDTHFLTDKWDIKIKDYHTEKLTTAQGGKLKPARPLCMFFEKDFFLNNHMSFRNTNIDGVKFDVGIHFYFKTLSLGHDVKFLPAAKTEYKDVLGGEYLMNGERFIYHNWYGTRWFDASGKVVHSKIDKIKYTDFKIKKDNLFEQCHEANE